MTPKYIKPQYQDVRIGTLINPLPRWLRLEFMSAM